MNKIMIDDTVHGLFEILNHRFLITCMDETMGNTYVAHKTKYGAVFKEIKERKSCQFNLLCDEVSST